MSESSEPKEVTPSATEPAITHKQWMEAALVTTGVTQLVVAEKLVSSAFGRLTESGAFENASTLVDKVVGLAYTNIDLAAVEGVMNTIGDLASSADEADVTVALTASLALFASGGLSFTLPFSLAAKPENE